MNFISNLWDAIWFFFWIFAFIAYLMALFTVIGDLFRDHTLAGGYKALWFIALIFVPFLTVLLYLIFRGKGLTQRQQAAHAQAQDAAAAYVRQVAGTSSPVDEIGKAKALLDAGTITQAEFDSIKTRALA